MLLVVRAGQGRPWWRDQVPDLLDLPRGYAVPSPPLGGFYSRSRHLPKR